MKPFAFCHLKTVMALCVVANPVVAQDLNDLSEGIGQIERGFWTRHFQNDMTVVDGVLSISHTTFTRVEWAEEGVPGRHVTDTLSWALPLDQLLQVRVAKVPGAAILEGSDQDSYCPLTVAEFSCKEDAPNCDSPASFYVCRYNAQELQAALGRLQQAAPQMVIAVEE